MTNNNFTTYTPEQVLRGEIKSLEIKIKDVTEKIENARQSIAKWEPELIELEKAKEAFDRDLEYLLLRRLLG